MRILILGLALAACEKKSELYCGEHPEDIANCGYSDAGIDARPTCVSTMDCVAPAPYCEVASGVCVECLEHSQCTAPDAMFCDDSTYTCKGCVNHSECASEVCLPSGTCGDDGNVAYVDPQATATTGCTLANKCMLVSDAIATGRPFVKLQDAIVEPVTVSGATVTFLADPGTTTLTRGNNGVVLAISGGSTVTIYDLTISGMNETGLSSSGSTARLFRTTVTNCNGGDKPAIEAKSSSTLTMSRSIVRSNSGGGIYTDSTTTYNITNSFIYRNGTDSSAYGGATLEATNPGERRFEMNTVVDNRAKLAAGSAGGVACFASGLAIPNNLIVRNYAANSTSNLGANELAVTAHCDSSDSMLDSAVAAYAFLTPDGTGPWDYHVGAGSMAIDRGIASDIGFDVDGHLRPQGTKVDVGADEYKQP